MKFEEIEQETPRLVILFDSKDGKDVFQWGLVGSMPIMSMLGAMVRIQHLVDFRAAKECPQKALVIVWDEANRQTDWFLHKDAPIEALIGMIEGVKLEILGAYLSRNKVNRQNILGPDGNPMRM